MAADKGKIDADEFRVPEGKKVSLDHLPTKVKDLYSSKKDYHAKLDEHLERMGELQDLLYAHDRYALLLIFQGMDAAGKDSAIKHVMSGVNPQGCQVFSFKQPSAQELDHDFLWRTTRCLPERGRIGIFNRSYYEEVLVVRVHPEILQAQQMPKDLLKGNVWKKRYKSIRELEEHLALNGTKVVKFFLHVSKHEQRDRFLARIDNPAKNWKFSPADIEERKLWDDYMEAYEDCLGATSTKDSPWYVVPADDKKNARLIISQAILDALESLKLSYPRVSKARVAELQKIRGELAGQH